MITYPKKFLNNIKMIYQSSEDSLDCIFVTASSAKDAYQGLAHKYMAIEPPTWSLLLAESCRAKNYNVEILDAIAENLTDKEVISRIKDKKPNLVLFVVYGQNPNAGTTGMIGASRTCESLKKEFTEQLIGFVGSHISALPKEVLINTQTDMVFSNEGVYALHEVLEAVRNKKNWKNIKGIGYLDDKNSIILNPSMGIVPQDRMDEDLPGYAWDLLPYDKKPLDLYRAHFWHAEFKDELRTPFATIYTSLGCVFGCEFCMINILNRTSNEDETHAGDSRIMRFWSIDWIKRELEKLHKYGVYTLRFADELFFFKKERYLPILKAIEENKYNFNIWAYARIDTVRKEDLKFFKKVGINWLCLGIEAGNRTVRQEISKGSFKDVKVDDIVQSIQEEDIYVLGNYIFGFPTDTIESMQETFDMAIKLNTEHANFYACTALPGSQLYFEAKKQGWYVPSGTNYSEFAFLAYDHVPLPTKTLTAAEVLRFRDEKWNEYFSNNKFLNLVEKRFGAKARQNVIEMSNIKLRRKILGHIQQ